MWALVSFANFGVYMCIWVVTCVTDQKLYLEFVRHLTSHDTPKLNFYLLECPKEFSPNKFEEKKTGKERTLKRRIVV